MRILELLIENSAPAVKYYELVIPSFFGIADYWVFEIILHMQFVVDKACYHSKPQVRAWGSRVLHLHLVSQKL